MGWFLGSQQGHAGRSGSKSRGSAKTGTRGKAKGKGKGKGKARRGEQPWDPQRTLWGLQCLGLAVLAVATVVGWSAGQRVLGRYAAEARGAEVLPEQVELVDAPAWLDPGLAQQLRRQVADQLGPNPLDRAGLREAVAQLDHSAWVEEVDQVRRAPRGRVKVTATYRRPAAVVAGQRGYHIVDAQGVWLDGPIDRAASRWSGLPLITGVNAPPPTEGYGHLWKGADIPAALALQQLLAGEVYADQITAYDVSHRDLKDRLWLVLYTDGPAIIWGLPPGQERSVEPQAPIKLAALRDWAYKHHGRINVRGEASTVWVYTGTAQIDARPSTTSARR